jgi:hypothetical protein
MMATETGRTVIEALPKDEQGEDVIIEIKGKEGRISVGYFRMAYPDIMEMPVPLSDEDFNALLAESEPHPVEQLNFARWRQEGII